ncbi:hypothetical protein Prudu_001507 [Prunus dulcis]|uniref:Uncharacterized protein n=1 Tax=Prunus dulcis TaxID=3755 RepID=A0A4Y1QNT0_PRUDU|nr:hypothetical protein Prudu_001507 [Prunus dulcis]
MKYKGFRRENERVLGFARESRREEAISGEEFVVVIEAEVISGEHRGATNKANCRKAKERGYFIGHKPTEVLEEQVVHGLWGLGVSSREESCPAHSYPFPVYSGALSPKQEDEVEWVRAQLSETERECGNLVTQKNLFESGLLQGMAGIIRGSTKVAVDIDEAEMQKRLRESRAKKG